MGVVDKGKSLTVDVEPKNAFVLRSTDMKFRAKVQKGPTYPWYRHEVPRQGRTGPYLSMVQT